MRSNYKLLVSILHELNIFICVQEVEYVKEEAKMVYLLECLQKTPPPVSTSTYFDTFIPQIHEVRHLRTISSLQQVLIFAEKKADVDAIHEYLLLKGVEAVAIHGGKGMQSSMLYTLRYIV